MYRTYSRYGTYSIDQVLNMYSMHLISAKEIRGEKMPKLEWKKYSQNIRGKDPKWLSKQASIVSKERHGR